MILFCTIIEPWHDISTLSSPVNDFLSLKMLSKTSSIISELFLMVPKCIECVFTLEISLLNIKLQIDIASLPETLITAIALFAPPVMIEQIVSSVSMYLILQKYSKSFVNSYFVVVLHSLNLKIDRMSILVNKDSRVIVQGFTGSEGTFHAEQMIDYGTNVVGGVTPGKGGSTHLDRPVFDTVSSAVDQTSANTSLIFVPPAFASDAIMESAEAGIEMIVCITEGIPTRDMIIVKEYLKDKNCTLVGPNCPGVITPDEAKCGIMPGFVFKKGTIGIVSKSGTLTYEAADQVVKSGLGVSTAIGIGGDPIIGTNMKDIVELFMNDDETEGIVMIGEIGGQLEADAARWIKKYGTKPVVGFIAGQTAPAGRTMGHAGAIVGGKDDTAEAKMKILKECGVLVSESPAKIGDMMRSVVK